MAQGTTRLDRGRDGAASAALLAVVALATLLILAGSPERAAAVGKVPKGAAKKLDRSPCPPRYAVRVARPATPEEISAAKRGRFDIAGVDVQITRNMDWTFDPLGSATFRARLHDLRWLDPLFYAYRENGDERALQVAKRIVVDWVKNNPLKRPTTDRTWFDKVAGDRGPYIAYATRAAECEGLLENEALARTLLASVQQHMRFLAGAKRYSPTNRGLFMDLGLLFSGRQVPFLPGANKVRKLGQKRFVRNVNDNTIFEEGMWLEHSTTYQFLAINAIDRFLEVDKEKRPGLEALAENMRTTAAWMTMPDRRWLQAGDSFQDKADRFAQRLSREQTGARVLAQSGIAFMKTQKSYLSLLSNYHSPIHKHSDELSFDLYESGHRVVADTGIPDKDQGTPFQFAVSANAHSVVQVDGADFPRDGSGAYGSGLLASGEGSGWYGIEASNPLVAEQGVEHNRLLLYKPGVALIVADRMRSDQTHTYRSHFQFGPDFGLDMTDDRIRLFAGEDQVDVFNESTDTSLGREVVRGETDPLGGFLYTDFRNRDPRWTETTVAQGSDVDNVTTLSIGDRKEVRASALGPLEATSSFAIAEDGELRKTLTVTRDGANLVIQETELPKVK